MVESITKGIEAPRRGRFTRAADWVLRGADNEFTMSINAAHYCAAALIKAPYEAQRKALIGTLGIKSRLARSLAQLGPARMPPGSKVVWTRAMPGKKTLPRLQCLSERRTNGVGMPQIIKWQSPRIIGVIAMPKIHLQIDRPLQTCQRWGYSYRTYRRRIDAGLLPPPIGKGIPSAENSLLIAAVNSGADDETLRRMVREIIAARPSLAASSA